MHYLNDYINLYLTYKNIFYILVLFSAAIMLINIIVALSLKNKILGGFVGRWLSILFLFMVFFTIAEVLSFFFISSLNSIYTAYFIISVILLFGSVFVAAVNRFIYHLINNMNNIK